MDNKKRLKAVHLESIRQDERSVRKELKILYGSLLKSCLLGMNMILVVEYKDVKGNANNIKKCDLKSEKNSLFCSV